MNKYQEALNVMDWNDRWVNREPQKYEEAKGLIQELVDKSTPKKPIGDKYNERCPACNEDSVRSDFASNYELKRCYECGQALDWSTKEEV